MKKLRITEKDYIKAVRRADRESEIERHGRPPARVQIHRSKRAYDRKKLKATPIEELQARSAKSVLEECGFSPC